MRLIPRQSPNALQRGDTMHRKRRNWGKSPVCQGFHVVFFRGIGKRLSYRSGRSVVAWLAVLQQSPWRRRLLPAPRRPHCWQHNDEVAPAADRRIKIMVTNPLTVMVTNPLTMIKRTLPCPVFFDPPDR
jgi:hypothetical protein